MPCGCVKPRCSGYAHMAAKRLYTVMRSGTPDTLALRMILSSGIEFYRLRRSQALCTIASNITVCAG